MVTGAFDWLANGDLFSPGIMLVIMLVGCLGVIMFNVIQALLNLESLWISVVIYVYMSFAPNAQDRHSGTHVLPRSAEVSMLDDKQQILGVTMTAKYRNGWVATLIAAGISSIIKILQTTRAMAVVIPKEGKLPG
eukprot:Skav225367  [mRNA]  locus=scaffold476:67035:71992:- [translate_table: standard]